MVNKKGLPLCVCVCMCVCVCVCVCVCSKILDWICYWKSIGFLSLSLISCVHEFNYLYLFIYEPYSMYNMIAYML